MTAPTMRVTTPGGLITAVPYILGFRPTESLVAITLKDRRVGLTSRMDLPVPAEIERAVASLVPPLLGDGPEEVILIAYTDTDPTALLDQMGGAVSATGVSVRDRLVVSQDRWRSIDCTDPVCCPPEGTPLEGDDETAAVASEFVGHGVAPLPDRAALTAQLEPGPAAERVARLLARPRPSGLPHPRIAAAIWRRLLDPSPEAAEIATQDASWAARMLRDLGVRDGICAWLTSDTLQPEDLPPHARVLLSHLGDPPDRTSERNAAEQAQRLRTRLIQLCALLPDSDAAPALTVLAAHSWWRGDGALARVALDRALRCEPDYRLALLLHLLLSEGIAAPSR